MNSHPSEQGLSTHTRTLVQELRRLRWALALIAGLTGALAVHLIFCQTFLPGLVEGSGSNPSLVKGLTALSDATGAVFFMVVAAPTLRVGP
jgi:hypothetical protein